MKEEAMLINAHDSIAITSNFSKNPTNDFCQQMVNSIIDTGYSKGNLAKELGISVSTINRIMRGVINQPGGKTFSRLMRLYCAVCVTTKN